MKGRFIAIYRVKSEFHIALISALINFLMFPFFSVTIPFWMDTQGAMRVIRDKSEFAVRKILEK